LPRKLGVRQVNENTLVTHVCHFYLSSNVSTITLEADIHRPPKAAVILEIVQQVVEIA
jgi:hypothetical protein